MRGFIALPPGSDGSRIGSSRIMPITKNTRIVATPRRWLPVHQVTVPSRNGPM